MIDGHKPDDNVDLAESRDVNCVSKTAIIMMLMSVMTKMMVTTIAT